MVLLLEHKLVTIAITTQDKLTVGSSMQLVAVGTGLNGSSKKSGVRLGRVLIRMLLP